MSKILKNCNDKKVKLDSVYKPDGTLTETPDETLEIMEKSNFKDGDPPAHTNTNTSFDKHLSQIIYSESRMQEAISSFDPLKAAGPDTLQPLTIQKAWHHIHKTARNVMIKSHEMQHVPGSWTESNGIFLPKPGKTDYNKPNSYRTINLSQTLLKLWHMQHDLGMEYSLSKKQFSFKKGTSTETALHKVIHKIEKRIAKKGYVLGTFLDIEGAFDNVSFKAISEAIDQSPLDSSTAPQAGSKTWSPTAMSTHKNATRRIKTKRGCPHGGVLSPFLWNLVIDDSYNTQQNTSWVTFKLLQTTSCL